MSNLSKLYASASSLALAFAAAPSIGLAAQDGEQAGDSGDRIVVTASRREQSLQDVPLSIAYIPLDDLTQSGKTNLNDILFAVPGVFYRDGGSTFRNEVFIRGINATGAAGVGTYIDDIPYGSTGPFSGGGAPIDGVLLDLDHVEVLKGPQGTLYGASAMGGLLAFKTRDPSLENWAGSVSADLSGTHRGGLNQLYRVSANGPVMEDAVGLSATAFWKDKSGFVDNAVIPHEGVDDYEYYGGSASLLVAPSENLDIKVLGVFQKSQQDGFARIQVDSVTGAPLVGRFETGDLDLLPNVFKTRLVGADIDYDLGWGTVTSVSSYQESRYSQRQDVTFAFAGLVDQLFPGNAPHTSVFLDVDTGFDKITQEVRLTSKSDQKFEWLLGGYFSHEEGFSDQVATVTPDEPDFLGVAIPSELRELAVFGNATYYVTPDFDVGVGVRHSRLKSTLEIDGTGPLVPDLPLSADKADVTTYLVNLRYRPNDNTSIYARAASGYRPGGANAVLIINGEPIAPPFFLADSLWSYEAGIKGTLIEGRLGYDVAGFYIDWSDYQIFVVRSGLSVVGNAGEAHSQGAEASLSYAATDALTFTGSVAYTDAEIDTDEPDLGGVAGEQIPFSAKWNANVGFDYDLNVGNVPAFFGGTYSYKGSFPIGFDGSTATTGVLNNAYHVVDIRAGFSLEHFDVSVYAANLFDEYATTNISQSVGFNNATILRPRTIGVVLTAKFN